MKHFLLLLLILPMASGATVDMYVDLAKDGTIREEFIYHFNKPYSDTFTQKESGYLGNISVTANGTDVPYNMTNVSGDSLITINPDRPLMNLRIDIVRQDKIFSNNEENHYFTELELNPNLVRNISAKVALPAGYGIAGERYTPASGLVESDGQRVILAWPGHNVNEIEVVSVRYAPLIEETDNFAWEWLLGLLIIGIIGGLFYHRSRVRRTLLRGFREDEQKALEYIREKKEILQKELHKEFNFSRAKCTRIIKKFEEQRLIEKEGSGRTNKIRWKG